MLEPEKKQASGKEQIAVSRGNIEAHLRTHNDGITGLLLKNDKSEKERRAVEEVRRVQRYNEIQNEAIQSAKNNAALEMRWAELKEEEQCERLFEAIEEQKKLFSQLIDSKDKLIQEFWDELKRKDDEYVKNLREQATEIDELISKMRTEFREMRETYLMELEEIEKEYNQERKETMMKNEDEIKKQFAKHAELEKKSVDSRDEREKKYAKDFEDLRVTGAKNYAEKKIMHETECQNLEKCFEDMKALYLLNSEKLEYYLKVLKEKDDENKALFLNLKNKAQTLNAKLRTLNAEYKDVDNAFENNNKSLTDEYKRISAAFKKLQDKFKHFERADLDRYSEIQKMNEVEVVELKSKILKADRTIHIQHLGLVWTPPEESAENKDGGMADASKSHSTSMLKQSQPAPEAKPGIDEVKKEITVDIPEEHLTVMIDMLIDESDFLLDDLVREQSTRLGKMKKLAMILDQVKKYLAIDSPEEMNMFLEHMYKKTLRRGFGSVLTKKNKRRVRAEGEEGEELEGEEPLPDGEEGAEGLEDEENFDEGDEFDDGYPMIDENDPEGIRKVFDQNKFIPALTKFMEEKPERKKTLEEVLAKKARKEETEREKKERIAREGKKYWENLTNVLPEKSIRLWKVLDKAFAKYYSVLEERQRLIEETTQLHNQNEELRNLLNQYLQINHELIIPPTSTIKMDQMS